MDNLILEGKVIQLLPQQSGESTRGAWKKQDFVIETIESYPKKICVSGFQDIADKVANLKEGDSVKVAINIESREYNSRWYTDIKAWEIENVASQGNEPTYADINFNDSDEDKLPF